METLIVEILIDGKAIKIDFAKPLAISIPFQTSGVKAFYSEDVKIDPIVLGDFIGEIIQGSPVNFKNIFFNPHGNGTHTECIGHIHKDWQKVNQLSIPFLMSAKLVSLYPAILENGDHVITKAILENAIGNRNYPKAVVIRTLPNYEKKKTANYSGTNPAYFSGDALSLLVENNVEHLLTDLPSIDREEDGGKLAGHKIWWDFVGQKRYNCTITELIFVPDSYTDGEYLLNLGVANFSSDASPSNPILFKIKA